MSEKIELDLAFRFECPACNGENFVRSVIAEFTREESEEFEAERGQRLVTGDWVTQPEEVSCSHCHSEFETTSENPDC